MKCHDARNLMHEYLDEDIDEYSYTELFKHTKTCNVCKQHFDQLQMTENLLRRLPSIKASQDCVKRVLSRLPKTHKDRGFRKWIKRNPFVAAASIFLLLFTISMASYQIPDNEFKIVSGEHHNLIVRDNEVIVPKGKSISGDLIIENGNLKIDGEVKGNVTVVNGKLLMANASQVSGNAEQIDQLFEWVWFQAKKFWNNF